MDLLAHLLGGGEVRVAREDEPVRAAEVRATDLVFFRGQWLEPFFGNECSLETLPHCARFMHEGVLCWRSGMGSNGHVYRLADADRPFGAHASGNDPQEVRAWLVRPFGYRSYVVQNPPAIKPDTLLD